MSSSSNNGKTVKRRKGVDSLLTTHGKALQVGQGLSIRLIKGPSTTSHPDPVDPKAPHQAFPILAKFPVSVVKPDFTKRKRMYQQDVPKAVDDSDEEAAAENEDQQPKRRWKSRRKEAPQRQWVLQDEVEFLETMLERREKATLAAGAGGDEGGDSSSKKNRKLSTRYEGEPEQNTSHYMVLRVMPEDAPVLNPEVLQEGSGRCLQACLVPTNAMVAFAQPDSRKTFSLSQAERVINDQRNGVQTMHHLHDEENKGAPKTIQEFLGRRRGNASAKPNDSKSRLLNRFKKMDADVDDGDDVMADVAYRNRKGAGRGRKELLETVGDEVKVSDEGVLGGANDAEFGGRQRFGQYKADPNSNDANKNNVRGGESEGAPTERGADGAAMADDFYQRDVQAEYEEMDYDANELFDDDDVDVGEADVQVENTGYGGADDEDDADDSEEEEAEEEVSGAEGLASVAGFKALLAKARGDGPAPGAEDAEANGGSAADKNADANGQGKDKNRKANKGVDHISKILAATGKRSNSNKRRNNEAQEQPEEADDVSPAAAAAPPVPAPMDPTVNVAQVGPDGLRVLTLEAVRGEIWLNHGTMETKRLMKIFDVKKKSSQERRENFRKIVKELCTVQQDPVKGNVLVLKQHWSHMG